MAKSKGKSPSPSSEQEEHSGSFGAGLFLGVVAGSFGMFLFGTPQGLELLQHIKEELKENPDTRDLPERAQKLLATVQEKVENTLETAQQSEEFPKFKRRLAE